MYHNIVQYNFLHLTVDFKGQSHYGKVKSRSHDIAHLHSLANFHTKYQDIAQI